MQPVWLFALLPILISVAILVLMSRQHQIDPRRRIWAAGFIAVLLALGATAVFTGTVGVNALMAVTSTGLVASSVLVLRGRRRLRALLLDLEPVLTWYQHPWYWYSSIALYGEVGLVNVLGGHNPVRLGWLTMSVGWVVYAVVRALGRGRLEVREGGVALPTNEYLPWKRISSYTLIGMILTVQVRPVFGPGGLRRIGFRGSPEQRQTLRHLLDKHLPAVAVSC